MTVVVGLAVLGLVWTKIRPEIAPNKEPALRGVPKPRVEAATTPKPEQKAEVANTPTIGAVKVEKAVPDPEPEVEDDGSCAGYVFFLERKGSVVVFEYEHLSYEKLYIVKCPKGITTKIADEDVRKIIELTATEIAKRTGSTLREVLREKQKTSAARARTGKDR